MLTPEAAQRLSVGPDSETTNDKHPLDDIHERSCESGVSRSNSDDKMKVSRAALPS